MDESRPDLPLEELRAAAGDRVSHAEIDALHAELLKQSPSRDAIAGHVERLRQQPRLVAIVENWFDDPRVQTFLADLSSAGL